MKKSILLTIGILIAGMAAFAIPKDFSKKDKLENVIQVDVNHIVDLCDVVADDQRSLDDHAYVIGIVRVNGECTLETEVILMPTYNLVLSDLNLNREYSYFCNNKIIFMAKDKMIKPPSKIFASFS